MGRKSKQNALRRLHAMQFRMSDDLIHRIKIFAAKNQMFIGDFGRLACEEYLENHKGDTE